jgi:hypothetical protein
LIKCQRGFDMFGLVPKLAQRCHLSRKLTTAYLGPQTY